MKYIIFTVQIIFLAFFAGCTKSEENENGGLNAHYLRSKIDQSFEKLKDKIIQTGSPTEGPLLMQIAQNVDKKTEGIIEEINRGTNITEAEINDLVKETEYSYGSLGVDSTFILNAYSNFKKTADKEDLILSLLLFDLDVHHSTWNYYNGFYYDFNYVKPIAFAKNYKIKKGDFF